MPWTGRDLDRCPRWRTNFTYDVSGNTTALTDAAGNTTRYELDRRDRTVLDINALGKTRQLQYDNADRLTRGRIVMAASARLATMPGSHDKGRVAGCEQCRVEQIRVRV